jgi:hypothetical protein
MSLQPQQTYVHLALDGTSRQIPGDSFWQDPDAALGTADEGWLIAEFAFSEDWPNWEMHPEGDEFVYLIAGAVDLLLDQGGQIVTHALDGSGAVLVPRGVWHTAKVRMPSRVLHVTRGAGTEQRPV